MQTEKDIQFYNSLHLAKEELRTCAKNNTLNEEACLEDWKHYTDSQQDFENLKKDLSHLIDDKESQELSISGGIMKATEEDEAEIEEKYTSQINELKKIMDEDEN